MTDSLHPPRSSDLVDCSTELLAAREEILRLQAENRRLCFGMKDTTTGIEPVETIETEALLELSEELIWAFVRMNFNEVREIFGRFHDSNFKAGLESALEELETRITPEEFKAHMDRVHASLSPQHRSEE